jgi:multicomponent Na+:H+ antiporter subunit G
VTQLVDALSWLFLVAGGLFCIIGAVGLLRMPDFYTRVHAASVVDTLGAGLMLIGLLLQAGLTLIGAKLLVLGLLLLVTSPTGTHALVRAAMLRGVKPLLADDIPTTSRTEETPPSKP